MTRAISIHVGLNSVDPQSYGGWSGDLAACQFDAEDMFALATGEGFSANKLLTKEATSRALLEAIRSASDELEAGDILLLTYAGHGGRIPDTSGDEDDEMDETWVLYDRQLLDDELHAAYAAFAPGVRLAIFSDSCHSGTVTRVGPPAAAGTVGAGPMQPLPSAGLRTRAMPPAVAQGDFLRRRALYESVPAKSSAKDDAETPSVDPQACIVLISGCQDNQVSLDGTRNGLFTATLLTVWNGGQFHGGYRRFRDRISARMPDTQSPNYYVIGAQNPEFLAQKPFTV
ncbi:caspase family protein [[Micrococcus luteus] ATCC 49442]|uniref:caspase family protein n=1 Tax=[Micrococcus luteus] ATCC 49442 TaxID=2698727 RepID=UPI0013DC0B43|nr:caspase family protein [[Micrococcus luteus] ATCC 49442]